MKTFLGDILAKVWFPNTIRAHRQLWCLMHHAWFTWFVQRPKFVFWLKICSWHLISHLSTNVTWSECIWNIVFFCEQWKMEIKNPSKLFPIDIANLTLYFFQLHPIYMCSLNKLAPRKVLTKLASDERTISKIKVRFPFNFLKRVSFSWEIIFKWIHFHINI